MKAFNFITLAFLALLQTNLSQAQVLQQRLTAINSIHSNHDAKLSDRMKSLQQTDNHEDEVDSIPYSVRAYWMRRAVSAIAELTGNPCHFAAFGTAIVNHTVEAEDGLGKLVCIGVNENAQTGNPTLHGETAAITNCTQILSQPPYSLPPTSILTAFQNLSLYTTAEACPMCASAIRWSGFREYIYGTSIPTLKKLGWHQFDIPSHEVFRRSAGLGTKTRFVGSVLANETDALFGWQFEDGVECPFL